MRIDYRSGSDWGCEHTVEDSERWLARMEQAIRSAYPAAEVRVHEGQESRITVTAEAVWTPSPPPPWTPSHLQAHLNFIPGDAELARIRKGSLHVESVVRRHVDEIAIAQWDEFCANNFDKRLF